MKNHNNLPMRFRTVKAGPKEFLGRLICLTCGSVVSRGMDRPYCLEHSEYAQQLIRIEAERKAPKKKLKTP